jgi:Ca2+-binding RTX toxin-like protein
VRFFGSDEADGFGLSRAGTPAAPLVFFDTAGPITIGANCRPAVGDPTTALCAAPIEAGSVLCRIFISSGGGDDVIAHGASVPIPLNVNTGPGQDVVNGGPGMDLIAGGSADDLLRGGEVTDQIAGSTGNDVLEGGPGYGDGLNGGSGDDRLFGGEGDHDNLDGGVGTDQIDGGPGDNDTIVYQYRTSDVTVRLGIDSENNGEGIDGSDVCVSSPADDDSPTTCEAVVNRN